jgi:hypothetical protein
MINDRKYTIVYKKNLMHSNVKVGMWKGSGTISRNVC